MSGDTVVKDGGSTSAHIDSDDRGECDGEKTCPPHARPRQAAHFSKTQLIIVFLGILALAFSKAWDDYTRWVPTGTPYYQLTDDDMSEEWPLEPIGTVKWWPCTGDDDLIGSECGYIVVPKDHLEPLAGTAKIALGRFKAETEHSKGTVLFHPGEIGSRGKSFVTEHAHLLWYQLGNEYDIVGFDSRGTGESQPKIQCFNNRVAGQEYTNKPFYAHATFLYNTVLDRGYDFPLNITKNKLRQILLPQQRVVDAMQKTQHQVCYRIMGDDLKHMGTTNVVRDLDAITTALDGEDAPINFVSGSYGSIIGQYLVNIFPERVGRVALDGVVDPVSWTSKPSYRLYRQQLSSAEEIYKLFLSACSRAGPEQCLLAQKQDEDPTAIRDRLENFLNELYYSPLPVRRAVNPTIFTGQAWKHLFTALHRPDTWSNVARQFTEAMNGDATSFINASDFNTRYFDLERPAVLCNDGPTFSPPSVEDIVDEHLDVFYSVSSFVFAAMVADSQRDPGCQYWHCTPSERFVGPWNYTPSNPVMIIGNNVDPIAPFSSVAKSLGNSYRLLLLDAPGHALAATSKCVVGHMKAYFTNGTLPPEGTVCLPDAVLEDEEDDFGFDHFNLKALDRELDVSRRRGYLRVTQ